MPKRAVKSEDTSRPTFDCHPIHFPRANEHPGVVIYYRYLYHSRLETRQRDSIGGRAEQNQWYVSQHCSGALQEFLCGKQEFGWIAVSFAAAGDDDGGPYVGSEILDGLACNSRGPTSPYDSSYESVHTAPSGIHLRYDNAASTTIGR